MNEQENSSTEGSSLDETELQEIESLLTALPLRSPPASLDRRVSRLLMRVSFWQQARLIGLGAAAMFVVSAGTAAVLLNRQGSAASHAPAGRQNPIQLLEPHDSLANVSSRPILVQHTTTRTGDDVVGVVGQTELQVVHRRSIQQAWVIDPKTGARVSLTIPRDEMILRRAQIY